MFCYYFDTSALVKRYVPEIGSRFIRSLLTAPHLDFYAISELAIVETTSGLRRRERNQEITPADCNLALQLFTYHLASEYWAEPISRSVIDQAATLTGVHPLRALDAIQLATALAINRLLVAEGAPPIILLSADGDLLKAASRGGLRVGNPNDHASPDEMEERGKGQT